MVKFGEVLMPNRRPYVLGDDEDANLVGMRLYALGPFHRELKPAGQIRKKSHFVIREGDIIYNKLFAWKGTFGIVPPELDGMFVSDKFPTYALDDSRVDPSYLRWYFRYPEIWEQARRLSTGSAALSKLTLNPPKFLELTMPLPPIEEQRRVVEKLNRLATAQMTSQRVRLGIATALQQLSRTVSRQAFAAISDAHECRVDEVCTLIIDCLHSNPVYSESGVPTVRSPDVGWGELLLATARTTSEVEYVRRSQRGEPQPGDIVLVREGGGTGKAGIVRDGQRLSLGQRVMLLRPNRERILPHFLLQQWLSPVIQADQIAPRMKGSASPHLNIGALRQFRIACPPLGQQQALVDHVERLGGRIARADALLEQSKIHSEALLPAAISGFWE